VIPRWLLDLDSPGDQWADTMAAGAGLCDPEAVRVALDEDLAAGDPTSALLDADATAVLAAARQAGPGLALEVEVETLDEVAEALEAGCQLLLLDNMELGSMSKAVAMAAGRARTEASGGITLASARAIAATGVDYLAIGGLTHSAPALDIGLDW
jgi:nicotinate-nucleotide pyrophosphorylase